MTLHDEQQETADDQQAQTILDKPARRGTPGSWKPGQSGNPKGRRAASSKRYELDVQALAQDATRPAIKALTEIVKDRECPAASRVSAANVLLERGWGKAAVKVDVTHSLEDFFADVVRGLDRAIEAEYSEIKDLPAPDSDDDTHSQD